MLPRGKLDPNNAHEASQSPWPKAGGHFYLIYHAGGAYKLLEGHTENYEYQLLPIV